MTDTDLTFYPIQVGELEFNYAIRRGAVLRILVVDGTSDLDTAVLAAKAMNCEVVELLSDPPNKSGGRPSHSVLNYKPQEISDAILSSEPDQSVAPMGTRDLDVSPPQTEPAIAGAVSTSDQQEPETPSGV